MSDRSTERAECRPKTGWLSGETYCKVHGRSAGWPCAVNERRPCKGRNSNVCAAEGCYGEACLTLPPGATTGGDQ